MTSTAEPAIRDATVDDAPAMLEVIQAAYDRWPPVPVDVPAIDHLRWKMTPPADVPLHHVLVSVDSRPAATQIRWAARIRVAGTEYPSETGADLAVHPDFRGLGLSRIIKERDHQRLAAEQITGFGMLSNAPQVRHMNEPDLVSRRLTTWTRPFRAHSYLSVHLRERGLARALWALRSRSGSARALPPHVRIEVITRFDDRIDELWAAAGESFDVIPVRDARHLNWRFQLPESGSHTTLALLEEDRILAYAVVRRAADRGDRGDRGDLVDWLWRPGTEPLLPALLDAAIANLRAARVTTWLPHGHPAEPVLRGAGFARVGTQHILFGARSRLESPPDVHAIYEDPATTLHMTMSDFDFA